MDSDYNTMCKVIHIIPYDGIGGVESAARTLIGIDFDDIAFSLDYIYRPTENIDSRLPSLFSFPIFIAVHRIILEKPDLLIISLWRACIVGILVKWLQPQTKLVLMLHCPNNVHWPDRFLTSIMARYANQVWADSQETLSKRLPNYPVKKGQVISFVARRLTGLQMHPVKPNFIFWGRLHTLKRLERAVVIFSAVHASCPDAQFTIIGPDGGALEQIKKQIVNLGLSDAVHFLGPMNISEIEQQAESTSFYLQTSELEGMAMSVVEAMQLGLVPVVTPVGEIGSYCQDGENSLLVYSVEKAVNSILALLVDNNKYQVLRNNAMATWQQQPLYAESLLQACRKLLLKY